MAIRSVVLRGFGTGSFNGAIKFVTTRGYISDGAVVEDDTPVRNNPQIASVGKMMNR